MTALEKLRQLEEREAIYRKNVDCYFTDHGRRCQVTRVTSFSGVPHFGFITVDDKDFITGWIPCEWIGGCEYGK